MLVGGNRKGDGPCMPISAYDDATTGDMESLYIMSLATILKKK
jgi:hypothetical protein